MIILDTALEKRAKENNPVRVALVGAGFMGRGLALQITQYHLGMELVAISNRNEEHARFAYEQAGRSNVESINSAAALDECIKRRVPAITNSPETLCEAEGVEVIIEATGELEFGAHVCLKSI